MTDDTYRTIMVSNEMKQLHLYQSVSNKNSHVTKDLHPFYFISTDEKKSVCLNSRISPSCSISVVYSVSVHSFPQSLHKPPLPSKLNQNQMWGIYQKQKRLYPSFEWGHDLFPFTLLQQLEDRLKASSQSEFYYVIPQPCGPYVRHVTLHCDCLVR